MDVEQSMHTVFKDLEEDELPTFQDPPRDHVQDVNPANLKLEDEDDDKDAFHPNVFHPSINLSGYPEPTLIPGKEGGKVKTFYKCDKCNKSFPKRKRYYNHKVHYILAKKKRLRQMTSPLIC